MAGVHALPLRHARPRGIYYGWYIVGAAVIAQMMAMGLQAYAMSVFLTPMTADLGWSREDFANAQTIGTFVSGGLGLFLGALIDRRGSRPLMIVGALITGGSMIGISRVDSLTEFYLLRGIGFTVGAMGIGNLVVNVTVSKWFVRNRGMAVALAATGISLGGVIVTPVTHALVAAYGWRDAWVILGIAVWLIIIPTAFVMRRTPEDHGLRPDGDPSGGPSGRAPVVEASWTRPQAVRTPALWLLIFAWGLSMAGTGALMLHMVSFLGDSGFAAGTAALLFSVQAWASLVAKPLWGLVMRRVPPRFLGAGAFLCAALALLGLLAAAGARAEVLTAVMLALFGLAIGGTIPLQETVWASYYGREHLGQIRSVGIPFTILFSALGPKFAAHLYDRAGTYDTAFLIFGCFWVVSAALILFARPPSYPAPPARSGSTSASSSCAAPASSGRWRSTSSAT
jgi:sugar phosphate permease